MAAMRGGVTTLLYAGVVVCGLLATNTAVSGLQKARTGAGFNAVCASRAELNAALGKAGGLLEQGRYPEAIGMLEPYAKAKCDPRVALLTAAAYEATGDVAGAEGTLAAAHAAWPANTSLAASLARAYMNGGQVDRAVEALNGFQVTAATSLQEMQEGVVAYMAGHRLENARGVAETAYKSYPSLATLLLLANVYQLEGRYKEVNRMLGEKRKTYGDSAQFLITLAESESDAMLFEVARTDLERAIAIDAKSYQAHHLLGTVLVSEGKTDQAETEFRTAIALAPEQPRTYFQLALIYRDRQDEAKEEALLAQALAADPHYASAYCEMGKILLGRRQMTDAIAQLNQAIENNPQLEQAYYLIARAYAGLGQKDKADAMVKQLVTLRSAHRHEPTDTRPGERGVDPGGM